MKTTLVIDDSVLDALREEAAKSRRTISELVESALRSFLGRPASRVALSPLPSFDCGAPLVDAADRDSLYDNLFGLEPALSDSASKGVREVSPARRGKPASRPPTPKRHVRR